MATSMTAVPTPGELVSAKTVCLVLKFGSFGNSKKASLAPVQVEADKSLLSLSKRLLDSPELAAIQKFDRELSWRIKSLSFQSLFKGGVYLLPIPLVTTVEEMLSEAVPKRQLLVEQAVAAYPQRIAETTERLGVTANATDYPSVDRYRASFYLEYSYVTFETPSRLKAISAALFQAETEKAQKKLESVAEECQQAMRAGMLRLVDHLAERLEPGMDGKPKRLHASTIENVNDFLKVFELKDITDDAALADVVVRARAVMAGVDAKALKSDELMRAKVLADLADLHAALDPLVIEKGTRAISLEDE